MKDLYEKMWDQIVKAFAEHNKMFLWIAERTLSAKDYKEFIDEFTKETNSRKEILDSIQNKQG